MLKSLTVFSGNANRPLAQAICDCLEVPLGQAMVSTFSDGEIRVEVGENVRGIHCYIVQPTSGRPNEALMELLILIDTLRRASAGSIVAIVPYFGYARQDRKAKPRTPITSKLVADLITAAGADRVLSVDRLWSFFGAGREFFFRLFPKIFSHRAAEYFWIRDPGIVR